jgi:hypothetical protein
MRQTRLVGAADLVDGELRIEQVSRRNAVFTVAVDGTSGYVLKCGAGRSRASTIHQERAVYDWLSTHAEPELRRHLVRAIAYDAQEDTLALELVDDAVSLVEQVVATRRCSIRVATGLGQALASLHRIAACDEANSGIPARLPWVFVIHRPGINTFRDVSAANRILIRTAQSTPALGDALDRLHTRWTTCCLIHNDLRWENILIPGSCRRQPGTAFKIVDWDVAGWGDPAWDVGTVFGAYLALWLSSIPFTGQEIPSKLVEHARYPLAAMQPAMRAFWASYAGRSAIGEAQATKFLDRATCYAAARLVQLTFERLQYADRLSPSAMLTLQVSLNMLQQSSLAASALLGIRSVMPDAR